MSHAKVKNTLLLTCFSQVLDSFKTHPSYSTTVVKQRDNLNTPSWNRDIYLYKWYTFQNYSCQIPKLKHPKPRSLTRHSKAQSQWKCPHTQGLWRPVFLPSNLATSQVQEILLLLLKTNHILFLLKDNVLKWDWTF